MVLNKKALTIIIPTYNMEKYLRRCLESLIVSDENMQRLEVLVINDGSKDSSSKIAHEYESRYPQTFRVIDKENGNYGSCINCGIKEAVGNYVKVLDADDWFDSSKLDIFIRYLGSVTDDMIVSDFQKVDDKGASIETIIHHLPLGHSLKFEQYCTKDVLKNISMHAVTYKLKNLKCINYHQTEGISYTDQEWIFIPMTTVKTLSYFDSILYKYLIGREGQTMEPQIMAKSMGQYEKMIFSLVRFYDSFETGSEELNEFLSYKLIDKINFIYNRTLLRRNLSLEFLESFDQELSAISPKVYDITYNAEIHKKFPFKFVRYYRKHHDYLPFYVNIVYRIMRG